MHHVAPQNANDVKLSATGKGIVSYIPIDVGFLIACAESSQSASLYTVYPPRRSKQMPVACYRASVRVGPFLVPKVKYVYVTNLLQRQIREPYRIRRAQGARGSPRNLVALARTIAVQLRTATGARVIVVPSSTATELHTPIDDCGDSCSCAFRAARQHGAGPDVAV